jgi:hypothetical protein
VWKEGRKAVRPKDGATELRAIRGTAFLRMLMTQLVSKFGDHGIHLIFEMQLLLLQPNFLDVIVFRHVPAVKLAELAFVLFVFLDQTAKLWIRGHQVFLDLLLLHHHHAPPIRMESLILRSP